MARSALSADGITNLWPWAVAASCQGHKDVMSDMLDHIAAVCQVLLLSVLSWLIGSVEDRHCLKEVTHSKLHSLFPLLI